jgi:glycosyltransferase involved in cell wall biosynthesis
METGSTNHIAARETRNSIASSDTRSEARGIVALIPAYNEERFIGSLVLAVRAYVEHVVVVDDGSSDRTGEIAQRAGASVVRHAMNHGKAAAVNTGFSYLRQFNPTAVVLLDGDGQHCADDIPTLLAPITTDEADVVIGSRFLEVRSSIPTYRQVGQHSLTLVTNLASGVNVSDSQSGFRAFSALALGHLSFEQGGFSLESEMQFLARDHRLRIIEVPIKVIYAEPAKRNPVSHGVQVLNGILHLVGQTRPLLFFGVAGLGIFLAGTLLGLYIIDIYARTHDLAVGYGLVTVVLCVVGVLLLFAGVILHSTRGMLLEMRRFLVDRLIDKQTYEADVVVQPDNRAFYHQHDPNEAAPFLERAHGER